LGTSGLVNAFRRDEEFEHGAAQISQLQTRRPDNIRKRDRPDGGALSDADCGKNKKVEQNYWNKHKYSEPDAERRSETKHCYCDRFHGGALQQQVGPESLNSL
jgi:hypothetical protein